MSEKSRSDYMKRYWKTDKGREALARAKKRYYDTPIGRIKVRAKWVVKSALKRGKITRQPCEICGSEPAQCHHPDYTRPLDVRWLCFEHHLNEHNKRIW